MATWFGDGLSNLKGQITNFTKEVLSEGIIEEIGPNSDERNEKLQQANEKCVELQEILNSKDAEIALLRRQNCELQKIVVESNAKLKNLEKPTPDDSGGESTGGGGFFWDPPSLSGSEKSKKESSVLEEELSRAVARIVELETEFKLVDKMKDEGHQKGEMLRAKQDMVNRIIQRENRETASNTIMEEKLQIENDNLKKNLEELDKQHSDSIDELLSLKEELERKHRCLQTAYEQLYVEYNESQKKVTMNNENIQTEDEDEKKCWILIERIGEILQTIDKDDIEKTLLENLELKDQLQMECEDLQNQIDSLIVELKHLKLDLPSIPEEANEERMTLLETEMDSLRDENKQLKIVISTLESNDRLMKEQLRMSEEKCRSLDENIELIEELKLDVENSRKELKMVTKKFEEDKLECGQMSKETIESLSNLVKDKDEKLNVLLKERDELVIIVKLKHEENVKYHEEIMRLNETMNTRDGENLERELERLRGHLVEIESNHTEEILSSEKQREELSLKLQLTEEKLRNLSTSFTSSNIRANQEMETLKQQLTLLVKQRDDIQGKLSTAEDKVLKQYHSLCNLQIVLEQFQRDKERDIASAKETLNRRLIESCNQRDQLLNEVNNLKEQLNENKKCLQAASRLSESLDSKSSEIDRLNVEVERLNDLLRTSDERIAEAQRYGEDKVDKILMKNLLLGYIASSTVDKSSVLRVFSTVLEFDESEKTKAGLDRGHDIDKDNGSLSQAFVKFLENESKPKPQLPALPFDNNVTRKNSMLLSNVNLPTFPDFLPNRNSGCILKEVLKDS